MYAATRKSHRGIRGFSKRRESAGALWEKSCSWPLNVSAHTHYASVRVSSVEAYCSDYCSARRMQANWKCNATVNTGFACWTERDAFGPRESGTSNEE